MWVAQRPPHIDAISPATANTGTTITVEGSGFGQRGRLTIDRRGLPAGSIRRWTPNLIIVTVPERQASGLVRVATRNGESNPVFLTVADQLPRAGTGRQLQLSTVQPAELSVGGMLILEGSGFGPRTGSSRIRIAGNGAAHEWDAAGSLVPVWTDRRIEAVLDHPLPPGRYSITINGRDTDTSLRIAAPGATAERSDPVSYGLSLQAGAEFATPELVLVLPRLPELPEQSEARLVETTREPVETDARSARYRFESRAAAADQQDEAPAVERIERTVVVERQTVRWSAEQAAGSAVLLEPWFQRAFAPWLVPIEDSPESREALSALAQGIDLTAPVLTIVRTLDVRVREALQPDPAGASSPWQAVLDRRDSPGEQGAGVGSAAYADLAAGLARQLGVPARRHMGVLLDDAGDSWPHTWLEYFVPGLGWYPSDPSLADGLLQERTSVLDGFYGDERAVLGQLDARRVTIAIDGREPVSRYPLGSRVVPQESWAPGHVWVETPASTVPDNLQVRWERPRLFPWFN